MGTMVQISPSTPEEQLAALQARMRACRLCQEKGYIPNPSPIFSGRLTDPVMVIGQAPGRLSDLRGWPFSGPAGKKLEEWFAQAGFAPGFLRQRTYLTSLTRCNPGPNPRGGDDRKPSQAELALCRPFLDEELRLVRPKVVLLVGQMAIEAFLGRRRLEEVVGHSYEREGGGATRASPVLFLPLPHTSGVSRWLNAPQHQRLVEQALAHLSELRVSLCLEEP